MAVYTTIDDPSAHYQTVLYSGTGNNDLAVTFDGNSDLQADMLWFKNRNGTQGHEIFDSTRGVATSLRPHNSDPDNVDSPNDRLMSFDSDGFELDDDGNPNTNTSTYITWGWKANGGTRTTFTESGNNPAGGRQVNTTAGFSIIDYNLNKDLVSEQDLKALEKLNIQLKFDIVLNHLSVASPQFKDLLKNGKDSKYKDFFINWNTF